MDLNGHQDAGGSPRERTVKLTYPVVVEQTSNNYAAYAPEVPGCISTGKTWDEMLEMIQEALTLHIEFLMELGEPVPEPGMSISEAINFHNQGLAKDGGVGPTILTKVHLVEVEVSAH